MSKLEQLLKQQQEIVAAIEAEKTKGRLDYAESFENEFITTDVWGDYNEIKWYKNIYKS